MATFNERLNYLRLEKNLSQKELGNILGYSESTISLYESGQREPKKLLDLIKIADYFDITLDYLLGRSDDKNSYIVKSGNFEFEVDRRNQDSEKNQQIKDKLKEILNILSDEI